MGLTRLKAAFDCLKDRVIELDDEKVNQKNSYLDLKYYTKNTKLVEKFELRLDKNARDD